MKRGKMRNLRKFLNVSEVFAEVILYLLMFGIFINIFVSIFTFELVEGLIRVGINVGFYVLLLGFIECIKEVKRKYEIRY